MIWAAFFNFVAFLIFSTHVANTIAKDVVMQSALTVGVIFAGLVGAIAWNLLTFGSASHQLVARPRWGNRRAAIARDGIRCPHLGRAANHRGIHCFVALDRSRPRAVADRDHPVDVSSDKDIDRLNKGFRRGQLASAAAFSLGHGGNDAQKTMGIILAVLIAVGNLPPDAEVPLWVVLSAHTAIALGTSLRWMADREDHGIQTHQAAACGWCGRGCAAAATLFFASAQGIPVSTTHTITGAIVGVGAARRMSAVRWRVPAGSCGRGSSRSQARLWLPQHSP